MIYLVKRDMSTFNVGFETAFGDPLEFPPTELKDRANSLPEDCQCYSMEPGSISKSEAYPGQLLKEIPASNNQGGESYISSFFALNLFHSNFRFFY